MVNKKICMEKERLILRPLIFINLNVYNFEVSYTFLFLGVIQNTFWNYNVSQSLYSNHCSLFALTFFIILLGGLLHLPVFES